MNNSNYKTTNNKYFNCPPRMDDARHFTDYRPNCHVNNLLRSNNSIMNSHEYRMFLTHNANKLMNLNRVYTTEKNGCGPCTEPYNVGTMLPEKNVIRCNKQKCEIDSGDGAGLGTGRQYDDYSGSCAGWPKDIPVNQPYNCSADNNNLFNYYNDMDSKAQGELVMRNAVPGGGKIMSGGDPKAYNN